MCNAAGIGFVRRAVRAVDVRGRRVLEVGSRNVNGSARPALEAMQPANYIGVDVEDGAGVDEICNVEDLVDRFGRNSFDVVVATELMEHVFDWRTAIRQMVGVTDVGGLIVITTRSRGFPYHGYPHDHWRYEQDDMRQVFGAAVELLEPDPGERGVFVSIRIPAHGLQLDGLDAIALFSMAHGKRVQHISGLRRRWYSYAVLPSYWSRRVLQRVQRSRHD